MCWDYFFLYITLTKQSTMELCHVHTSNEPIMLRNKDAHDAIATFIEPIMLQNQDNVI